MQLPPSLKKHEGLSKLERLVPNLWKKYRYAIEVRHGSWFHKDVYELLRQYNICLTWSQLDNMQTPPEIRADFIYLRFMGDGSTDGNNSASVQKDKEIARWARLAKNVPNRVKSGIVAANGSYASFGPATANAFKKMLGKDSSTDFDHKIFYLAYSMPHKSETGVAALNLFRWRTDIGESGCSEK